jgi:hypothetical protein
MKRLLLLSLAVLSLATPAFAQTTAKPACGATLDACSAQTPPATTAKPGCAAIFDAGQVEPWDCTRVWGGGEYLVWWLKGTNLPPLATTSSQPVDLFSLLLGSPPGSYGLPDTRVLFGDGRYDDDARSGYRLYAGYWLDREKTVGTESSYFSIFSSGTRFLANSAGNPQLARPFIALNGDELASPIAFPAFNIPAPIVIPPDSVVIGQSGGIAIRTDVRLQGFEQNVLFNVVRDPVLKLNLLGGFRYFQLDDRVEIGTSSLANIGVAVGGVNLALDVRQLSFEQFVARNQFFGGQMGCEAEWRCGGLFVNLVSKLALGGMEETVTVGGRTYQRIGINAPGLLPPGFPTSFQQSQNGALLAQQNLVGQHERDQFALIGELRSNVGYAFTENIRASVGYTFLYCNEVVRAGEQITRVSSGDNGNTVSPTTRPAYSFVETDFWAQGVNFTLELRY